MPYYFFTINFKTENGIRELRKSSKTPKAPLTKIHHSQRDYPMYILFEFNNAQYFL